MRRDYGEDAVLLSPFHRCIVDISSVLHFRAQRHHRLTGQRGRPAYGGRDAPVTVHGLVMSVISNTIVTQLL